MKHLIIYNPAAGQGRAGARLPEVEALLLSNGVEHDLAVTEYPGHAIALARDAAERHAYDAIVAAGGDGTANEVLNGIMAVRTKPAEVPALGMLCVGRGNDFAFGAGVSTDLEAGIRTLVNGHLAPIDVGYLKGGLFPDGRYFGNGVGIGFDTIVGFEAARMKRIKGFAGYVLGAIRTLLFYYKAPELTITTDSGTVTRACIQVSVMNGRRMGGAFYMTPNSLIDDGRLDLCIVDTPTRRQMLALIVRYLKGTQEGRPHVTTGRTTHIHVRSSDEPIAVHADGETVSIEATELHVECVSGQINVLRPADAP